MQKPIILVGGGGHCKSVIEVAESAGCEILGILDLPEFIGAKILGYEVLGSDTDVAKYADKAEFVVTLGFIKNPALRIKLHGNIINQGGKLATIIASTSHVSNHAEIGEGTVVLHQATVNAGAKIGKGVIINTAANIEHGVVVGDYAHISTGVMVNGDCKVGANTFIGSRSVLANGVKVCDNCVVGAGSIVIKDITESGTYVECPVRKL